MAICAHAVQQADGSYLLGLNPAVTDLSTCAYVVETGSENLLGSIASLSVEQALLIASAAAALWATMWGIRQLGHFLLSTTERFQDES